MSARDPAAGPMVRVWDPLVRIGHWLLVGGFTVAYLVEDDPLWLHTWAGYLVAGVVAFRVLWGFIGPQRARFADFVTGPRRALAYLAALLTGRAERHLGHSPAGGAMTVALLFALALTAFSGMATLAVEEGQGPLAPWLSAGADAGETRLFALVMPALADDDDEGGRREGGKQESVWKDVHEALSSLTLALIIAHVAGVAVASYAHRENLARAMVTGMKRR